MKFSDEQSTWFNNVRSEWFSRLTPYSAPMGRHIFNVSEPISPCAVGNARIFCDRYDAMQALPKNAVVAEVGTQTGAFAERMLRELAPKELHLFDIEFDTLKAARPHFESEFQLQLHHGNSSVELAKFSDRYFDFIYIDGDHSHDGVQRDASVAIQKVKTDGILVFNDYTMWSPVELIDYGVVPAVNGLLSSGEWEMIYLALHPMMYCVVAIKRKS